MLQAGMDIGGGYFDMMRKISLALPNEPIQLTNISWLSIRETFISKYKNQFLDKWTGSDPEGLFNRTIRDFNDIVATWGTDIKSFEWIDRSPTSWLFVLTDVGGQTSSKGFTIDAQASGTRGGGTKDPTGVTEPTITVKEPILGGLITVKREVPITEITFRDVSKINPTGQPTAATGAGEKTTLTSGWKFGDTFKDIVAGLFQLPGIIFEKLTGIKPIYIIIGIAGVGVLLLILWFRRG